MEEEEEVAVPVSVDIPESLTTVPIQNRRTINYFSLFEFVQILCTRAEQINKGSTVFVTPKYTDSIKIALQEILEGRSPLSIKRELYEEDDKLYVEIYSANELEIPSKCITSIQDLFESEPLNLVERIKKMF